MRCETLDYARLPGQHPLFLSFLHRSGAVRGFYPSPIGLSKDSLDERAGRVLSVNRSPRSSLIRSLTETQGRVGASAEALHNLAKLESTDCLAVLTGQQVGFLGGPSLGVYKAATAVSLARWVESQGYPCVPVFWMASDDSDFEEVRTAIFAGPRGEALRIEYPDFEADPYQTAGTVSLRQVGGAQRQLEKALGGLGTLFSRQVLDRLKNSYDAHRDFRTAFGSWLSYLFRGHGLIVFDPLAAWHRKELEGFYSTAVLEREDLLRRLMNRAADLRSGGWAPQVHVDAAETLLFRMDGNRRFKLEFERGTFRCKGKKSWRWSRQDLLSEIGREPEAFGPNALLRPILQDHLFPTLTTVGGPAEVAYFSQVHAISGVWGMEVSVTPRASFTVVDRKSDRLLKKHGLTAADVLTGTRGALVERVLREEQSGVLLDQFDGLKEHWNEQAALLQRELDELDEPLAGMMDKARQKSLFHLDKVRARFVENREQRLPHLRDHLDYLTGRLRPGGSLQERTLNFNHLLAEEGEQLLKEIVARVEPGAPFHQVLSLPCK